MKFLHTSDWHLGRALYGRKRYDEFTLFLDWLSKTIEKEAVDVLLVAGDIFDNTTPSNKAQELYYRFLCKVASSSCQHIVVVGGNHDSPSFLNAPKELLSVLNVHVVGAMTKNLEDEIIEIKVKRIQIPIDGADTKSDSVDETAIICAVPYLRDRDIRTVEAGESFDDKNRKLIGGLEKHYNDVIALAKKRRETIFHPIRESATKMESEIPLIAMGHLFTTKGKTIDGDGVRELYVGTVARIGEDIFSSSIDYLALGHLHVPQIVGGKDHYRYSGSPIPMGFGEATQEKQVVIIEFDLSQFQPPPNKAEPPPNKAESPPNKPEIKTIPIPCFQRLITIKGSLEHILSEIEKLKNEQSNEWLEIKCTEVVASSILRNCIEEALIDSAIEIRTIKNEAVINRVLKPLAENETLDSLDPYQVFTRCLNTFDMSDEKRGDLMKSYGEIVKELLEEDKNAK